MCEAHFVAGNGNLLGFALLGTATSKKQSLSTTVAPWL
jgi:hypothetical protein